MATDSHHENGEATNNKPGITVVSGSLCESQQLALAFYRYTQYEPLGGKVIKNNLVILKENKNLLKM